MGKRGNRSRRQRNHKSASVDNDNGQSSQKRQRKDKTSAKVTSEHTQSSTDGSADASLRRQLGLSVSVEGIDLDAVPLPLNMIHNDNILLKQAWNYFMEKKRKKRKQKQWEPTPIQMQSWPILLNQSLNLIGIAPTGSGKTLAYGLPMVSRAYHKEVDDLSLSSICGLVLVPTRELAIQVSLELRLACKAFRKPMKRNVTVRVESIYGGVSREEQIASLTSGNDDKNATMPNRLIVAGTPGRLLDLLKTEISEQSEKSSCALASLFASVRFIVLDEADRMAINTDIAGQVDSILEMLTQQQDNGASTKTITCLYSATFPMQVTQKWNEWVAMPRVCIKVDTITLGSSTTNEAEETMLLLPKESFRETDSGTESENVKVIKSSNTDQNISESPQVMNDTLQENQDETVKRESKHMERAALDLAKIPPHVTQILHVCSGHKKPRKLMTTLTKIRTEEGRKRQQGLCIVFFARIKTLQYISKLLSQEGFKCTEIHSHRNQSMRERALADFKAGKITILLATDIAARGIHVNNVEYVINYDFPGTLVQYVHRCGRAGRSQVTNTTHNHNGKATKSSAATVYSFFTRELAPMAKDVVALLTSSNAWVDPNLLQLVDGENGNSNSATGKRKRRRGAKWNTEEFANSSAKEGNTAEIDDDDMDFDEGQFASLSANRIVLKRASHVSDASESDEDSD